MRTAGGSDTTGWALLESPTKKVFDRARAHPNRARALPKRAPVPENGKFADGTFLTGKVLSGRLAGFPGRRGWQRLPPGRVGGLMAASPHGRVGGLIAK